MAGSSRGEVPVTGGFYLSAAKVVRFGIGIRVEECGGGSDGRIIEI